MAKKRLDLLLTEGGYTSSRERAKASIMAGQVFVNGQREDKPGTGFDPQRIKSIEIKGDLLPFVSRGGLKLQKAVKTFSLNLRNLVCMDIGASTGGFTDCMLQEGARRVYSIDVGYGQLDWRLRQDERVICMEKTNFRYLERERIPEEVDFASADVSFISLSKILPTAGDFLSPRGQMVCLIKPQFEAGRDKVGKRGVVRDKTVQVEVITRVMDLARDLSFSVLDLSFSPIRGPEGNIEFLLYLQKEGGESLVRREPDRIWETVEEAHAAFDRG